MYNSIQSSAIGKPNLDVFSETLQVLAAVDKDIVVITSDSRGSGKLVPFGERFPDQMVEVGIAEQNLVGIAAGLASAGKKVFAVSPACFLTARALEQIKNDVAYANNPVKLIGISAGVSYGALGSTHHSLHDFAALRAINNIAIMAPADNFETRQAILFAANADFPIYIRFGKRPMQNTVNHSQNFEFGKARIVNKGRDLTIIASGETVWPAMGAAKKLAEDFQVAATVISMHTLKPFDTDCIAAHASNGNPVITVEEHSKYGGLGEATAACMLEMGFCNKFKIVAIPDEYTVTGSQVEVFTHYGISADGIASIAWKLLSG